MTLPYIQPERRAPIDKGVDVALEAIVNPGDLNYAISRLCLGWLAKFRPSYNKFNTAMGVLSCAAMEMYIARVSPYEAEARKRNGEIL